MKTVDAATEGAVDEYLRRGHCAEVIFKHVTKAWHPGFDESLVRLGTPFGGGIADCGDTCGALVGGLLVVGYMLGRRSLDEPQNICRDLSREYYEAFKTTLGDTTCYGIRGRIFNWDTHVKCSETVKQAIGIVWELLAKVELMEDARWRY